MFSKTFAIALTATALAGALASAAQAQQLSPTAQSILATVKPDELQKACAKGNDGMTALVRDKILQLSPQERRGVQAEGPNIGKALGAKCPK
jgi:hypothetical protein